MSEHDIIKQRFFALNRDRLTRAGDCLRPRQRDVIDLLPFLFHVNHESLPGYISDATPTGISDYTPGRRVNEALPRLLPGVKYKRRALARYDIHSMFLMGSSGTIAHSSGSDFDIWLCHAPDLSVMQIADLQDKAKAIEKWAAGFGLEVHFFLMNADHFRSGKVVELSTESSGSAQHHLLLDEFYRTGILLAGRYPIWWLVPPEEESSYEEYTQRLLRNGVVRINETIDFGGLPRAPAEEFFGAALWQLYKSIDSPYKAALKLMLTETYAAEYPEVNLLSLQFKRAVHTGPVELTRLDPYVMLYRKIEEYLQSQGDDDRLELMRRCFYFKVGMPLSRADIAAREDWCSDVMKQLVRDWGWSEDYLHHLDTRKRWKIHQVLEERTSLVRALTQSYHALSRFGRLQNMLARIDQNDLNILGRKLYAAFERKAGKIDIVNRGISDDVRESHLSIHQTGGRDRGGWTLYRGPVGMDETESNRPLKRCRSVVELLTWCHVNQLIDERTVISLYARDSALDITTLRGILRALERLLPGSHLEPASFEALDKPPATLQTALFVNIGILPDTARLREGKHLTSDKSDALSYGGVCENRILSIDQIMLTSWKEVMALTHEGEECILEALAAHMRSSPPPGARPPMVRAYCFSPGQSMSAVRRVEELFSDVMDCYYSDDPHRLAARYVLLVGNRYYVLSLENEQLIWRRIDSHNELLRYLSEPVNEFRPVVIDRHALTHDILPLIYRNNKPGIVQIFCVEENQAVYLYFLDERGSLFCRRAPKVALNMLVRQYRRFLAAVAARQGMQPASGRSASAGARSVEVYQGYKRYHGRSLLVAFQDDQMDDTPVLDVQVITSLSERGEPRFTIYIEDREFSSIEFGNRLYSVVAEFIMERRKSGRRYPIHITDIDLAPELVGARSTERLQTVHYLEYKRQIEDRLNLALAGLGDEYAASMMTS